MKALFRFLLLAVCATTLAPAAQAQTRKPAAKPAVKPATKPAAKPAPKPATKPATVAPVRTAAPAPAPAPVAPPPSPATSESTITGPFQVGTNMVNVGIGLGNRYNYGTGYFGGSSSVTPALSVSYERGILEVGPGVVGVGGFVGYQGATYDFGGNDRWKFTDIIVTLRGTFHYPVAEQFDAYGGVNLGMRHASASFEGSSIYGSLGSASANEVAAGLFVGGRYFFTPSIGAFAELGYDQTYLKIGVAAKF
ncbi:hypothetical protein MUN81_08010 [Hymenobacter sp. 5317J-9]|uniref:hypothetical protein n=1 Tax=Hymenobacter sp. 5317J-9 TaxID=2932250 RepID=UPI001FD6DD28|nr:hypothetical protein [Hymenobacter sp. 5317J-9]UOQ99429.1 hypothetical protein MUN81_08010 [Hymenobacter sp. 5317J-9]